MAVILFGTLEREKFINDTHLRVLGDLGGARNGSFITFTLSVHNGGTTLDRLGQLRRLEVTVKTVRCYRCHQSRIRVYDKKLESICMIKISNRMYDIARK